MPPSTRAGKNGADMRLVIDALELCYAREHIDTFVIASGDSDFCPLAYKLRENDRIVIGLAVKEATSPLLRQGLRRVHLPAPAHGRERQGQARRRPPRRRGARRARRHRQGHAARAREAGAGVRVGARPGAEVPAIAREVVASLLARATGPLNPSLIKETIVRKEPDFDERDHGFSTFSGCWRHGEGGLLKRQQQGRQWYVVPPEAAAADARGHSKRGAARAAQEEAEDEELEPYPDPEDYGGVAESASHAPGREAPRPRGGRGGVRGNALRS